MSTAPKLASLIELRRAARQDFPEPETASLVELYIDELEQLLSPASAKCRPEGDTLRATSAEAEGQPLLLICKLEDYLESVLVGRWTKRAGV